MRWQLCFVLSVEAPVMLLAVEVVAFVILLSTVEVVTPLSVEAGGVIASAVGPESSLDHPFQSRSSWKCLSFSYTNLRFTTLWPLDSSPSTRDINLYSSICCSARTFFNIHVPSPFSSSSHRWLNDSSFALYNPGYILSAKLPVLLDVSSQTIHVPDSKTHIHKLHAREPIMGSSAVILFEPTVRGERRTRSDLPLSRFIIGRRSHHNCITVYHSAIGFGADG